MKNLTRTKTLILIASGLFIIALAQIIFRYINVSDSYDFLLGLMEGSGLGLIIYALIKGKIKEERTS